MRRTRSGCVSETPEMRKIVVLGSNSFSGSDFIDLLLEDPRNQVVGISRSPEKPALFLPYKRHSSHNFTFHQLDLNKEHHRILQLLDDFQPHYVVNFAAQSEVAPSWCYPEHWFQTNVVALSRLTNALRERAYLKRYVHISSPEVYGTCRTRLTESAPLNPSTPYAVSKAAGDLFLFTLVKQFNFPLVMIRSTNVYGPHQQLFKLIPRTIIALKLGETIQLHGGGRAVKSYIHIRDVSRGELLAMEKGRIGHIYHLSPPAGIAVRDVVRRLCMLLGKDFEKSTVEVEERCGQDAVYQIDSTRSEQELGWFPKITFSDGLQQTIEWVEAYWPEIVRNPREYRHVA
ncbi:MAG: NAD-dependent epimerase/dehydratase family protein [Nitrospirae bacterium]|nr:MAG: NAD-dependent epimerase/dehydratase family protein [Nitrospirota bacterium]